MRNDEIQCEAEIRKNIVLIECGKALTLPLARLMCDCRFKEAWNKWNAEDIREEVKAKRKAYRETPEVKAKRKAYRETPEVKAKRKAYYEKNREKILDNKKFVRIVKLNRRSLRLRTSNSS